MHPGDQGAGIDTQKFRCAVGTLDFPIRLLKNGQQIFTFPLLQFGLGQHIRLVITLGRINRTGSTRRDFRRWQVEVQHASTGDNHGPFNDISQFPDVARPGAVLKLDDAGVGEPRPGDNPIV